MDFPPFSNHTDSTVYCLSVLLCLDFACLSLDLSLNTSPSFLPSIILSCLRVVLFIHNRNPPNNKHNVCNVNYLITAIYIYTCTDARMLVTGSVVINVKKTKHMNIKTKINVMYGLCNEVFIFIVYSKLSLFIPSLSPPSF